VRGRSDAERIRGVIGRVVKGGHALAALLGSLFLLVGLSVGGCGSVSGGLHADTQALLATTVGAPEPAEKVIAEPPVAREITTDPIEGDIQPPVDVAAVTGGAMVVGAAGATEDGVEMLPMETLTDAEMTPYLIALAEHMTVAQASGESGPPLEPPLDEYDPWEPFNEAMFKFNYKVDRYVLKPIAKGYNFIVPDEIQRMIDRGFNNISFVPRFVNSLLQGKWAGAGREVARFLINSTIGIGGLWDMAKQEWGIEPSREDFGQTLGVWGIGPGPFLIVPILPPMTVRDGIGLAVDGAMDPLSYFIPFIWQRLVMKVVSIINDRSLNLEVFEGVEDTTVDLYTAVRNAYLQRRARQIRE
jgi:phospholipid-binding lipoprotein MlaA